MSSELSTKALEATLKTLGLQDYHRKVYIYLLTNGKSPASAVATSIGTPRSSTYDILNQLVKLGIVSKVKEETKTFFSPTDPIKLRELIEQKQKVVSLSLMEFDKNLEEIKALYNSNLTRFPKVRFYEGENSLRVVYSDALNAGEIRVICQGSKEAQPSLSNDPPYLKEFINETALRKIKTREILEKTPAALEYLEKYQSPTHKIKILPENPQTSFGHVDKHIYDGKVAFISHDNLVGVIIEDKTLYEHEKAIFDLLWKLIR